ncbi:MAG TPA: B12-binding domain-containing protein [Anaerolineales bacterium]|nr:B12-binding domain-containing protein [Anaerolineales bacterium]
MVSTTPAFNLKVVLKETGIAADTLRAWERRYGLPMPQRSAGGHRLYSQRDLETIKWLMKRQSEGLSISRAVDLWNEQLASGTDPLAGITATGPAAGSTNVVPYQSPDTTLDSLRAQWIGACLNFSESNAEQILNQAFSIFPVEAVCLEVIQKGMSEIGDLWYENRSTVQQEHFASGLAARRLDALLSASPAPTRNQTIIVGCPSDEWHTLTPLLLALLLRRRGLNVLYLGANVPVQQFSTTVRTTGANLVVLVAQHLISAASLQHTSLALAIQRIPVAFGGRIFNLRPDLSGSIAGHFLGNDVPTALDEIELILDGKLRKLEPKGVTQAYAAAHQAFLSKRPQIEMTVRQSLEPLAVSPEDIQTATHFLGENILAALQLGDLGHVSAEIDWLQGLLHSHGSSDDQLAYFMQAYSKAVDQSINGQGKPIFEWIEAEVQRLSSTSES